MPRKPAPIAQPNEQVGQEKAQADEQDQADPEIITRAFDRAREEGGVGNDPTTPILPAILDYCLERYNAHSPVRISWDAAPVWLTEIARDMQEEIGSDAAPSEYPAAYQGAYERISRRDHGDASPFKE